MIVQTPQDAEIDLLKRRERVHAELVGQQLAALVVRRERLGLAAGRIQRTHEQAARAFGQRISGEQHAKLADQAGSLAEARSASIRSARALERSSVSFAATASAKSHPAASASGWPRQASSASRRTRAASPASPSARARRPRAA